MEIPIRRGLRIPMRDGMETMSLIEPGRVYR